MTNVILECWTDGSTIKRKNSGRADCGIAYAVTDGNDILFCGAEFVGTQTSNYAELYAILRCLEEVAERIEGEVMPLVIHSDSEVCVKGLRGEYDIKSPNLKPMVGGRKKRPPKKAPKGKNRPIPSGKRTTLAYSSFSF